MKLVNPSVKEVVQGKGDCGYMQMMVYAGRLTHGFENKPFDNMEKTIEYIERMKRLGHGRVFEFGTIYMQVKLPLLRGKVFDKLKMVQFYLDDPYSRVVYDSESLFNGTYYITTNYRVLLKGNSSTWEDAIKTNYEQNRLSDLKYMCEDNMPTKYHKIRRTLVWDISRVTADSFRTHTLLSSLMQSTRYNNYASDRYDNCISFTRCVWLDNTNVESDKNYKDSELYEMYKDDVISPQEYVYLHSLCDAESGYLALMGTPNISTTYYRLCSKSKVDKPFPAERARGVLGLDVRTKFIQCAYEDDWKDFFRQRTIPSEGAHEDAQFIANKAKDILGL